MATMHSNPLKVVATNYYSGCKITTLSWTLPDNAHDARYTYKANDFLQLL